MKTVRVNFFDADGAHRTSDDIPWLEHPLYPANPRHNFRFSLHRYLGDMHDDCYAVAAENPEGSPLMLPPFNRYHQTTRRLSYTPDNTRKSLLHLVAPRRFPVMPEAA